LLADSEVTKEPYTEILTIVYESKYTGICSSDIAAKLKADKPFQFVNSQVANFGKLVIKKTGVRVPVNEYGKKKWWWRVPFLGYQKAGKFYWLMRPELAPAFEEVFGQDER
jgi:5-methylcytosine-specific restriction enzyme A